jgi:hypothetical protein
MTGMNVLSFGLSLLALSIFYVVAIIVSILFMRDLDMPETEKDRSAV